mgnify:CR=1 FL=1
MKHIGLVNISKEARARAILLKEGSVVNEESVLRVYRQLGGKVLEVELPDAPKQELKKEESKKTEVEKPKAKKAKKK